MNASISKSERIREYLAAGDLAPKDIAKKVKVSTAYVYQIRWSDAHKGKPVQGKPVQGKPVHEKTSNGSEESPRNGNGHAGMGDLGYAVQTRLPMGSLKQELDDMGWKDDPLVNHPPHYTMGKIETIDYIEAKGLGFLEGNVVKYITRAPHKGQEIQDLHKARWYLERAIEAAEAKHATAKNS